jgi:hypothetical protein
VSPALQLYSGLTQMWVISRVLALEVALFRVAVVTFEESVKCMFY